ncbi:MAG: MFS transporter, partial [Nostocoides sp.]
TGLALLPLAVGSFVASGFGGQLAGRRGAAFVVRLGIALEIVGIASIGLVVRDGQSWWPTVPCLLVYGMGVGLATAQLTGVVLVDVPPAQSGQGSGTQSTSRQVGSALGIAVLGTVLFTSLGTLLSHRIEAMAGIPTAQRDKLVSAVVDSAGAAITGLERSPATAAIAQAARVAFTDAVRWTALSAVVFLVLGFLTSLALGREQGRHVSGPDHDLQPDSEGATRAAS